VAPSRINDRGQGTVELALALPVLVMAMLAVVQVGLIGRDQLLVWHAARESARAAAVDPQQATARAAAVTATSALDPGRLVVTVGGGTTTGDLVTASVRYRSATEVPLVGRLIGDVDLSAEVTMRVE
jgi:Flp pilus assembly protein TadG